MRFNSLLALSIPALSVAGCVQKEPVVEYTKYPKMSLSQDKLDFGSLEWGETAERTVILSNEGYEMVDSAYVGMQMGVGTTSGSEFCGRFDATTGFHLEECEDGVGIFLGKSMDGSFSVDFDTDDITCPEGSAAGDTGQTSPDAKSNDSGSSGSGEDSTGGGGGEDSSGGSTDEGSGLSFQLGPHCSIPVTVTFAPQSVGEIWGSIGFNSFQAEQSAEDADAGNLPEYLRDPLQWYQQVFVAGEAAKGEGTVVVTPRSFDYGYVYPGSADSNDVARIAISNVGTGDLTLGEATLADTCDSAFAITSSFSANTVLAAGDSTLVEVTFNPEDDQAAYCELAITSDDAVNSSLDVTLKGNSGADPENVPPTVAIRSPLAGYEYNSPNSLELEINIFDKNQPATSLSCKVKSLLSGATLADCSALDDSGHVIVDVPRDSFDTGIDTLTVTVTDAEGISVADAVSILINTAYPDSDDDGDGYGVESTPPDCDDHNQNTYPDAAEVFDVQDNDCDGVVDEGTEGFDDDGDDVTEDDGDCNDYNAQVYPGAPERADSIDNDCDGRVDEGTSLYDDDGDGFAEVNNDCDDSNSAISPSAAELCDGLDNDCDGLKDSADGCISTDSAPVVIGFPDGSQNACQEGDIVPFTIKSFDADGQTAVFSWGDDKNTGGFDNTSAQTVNWQCPALADGSGGGIYTIYVLVTDPDGHQDWGDTKVSVYPDDYGLYDDYSKTTIKEVKTCSTAPQMAGLLGSLVAGLAAMRRRRG